MSHSHSAPHPLSEADRRRHAVAVRIMVVVLVPIAIWTVVAMVVMWPRHVHDHIRTDVSVLTAPGTDVVHGTVAKIAKGSCEGTEGWTPGDTSTVCADLDVRMTDGPDAGKTAQVPLQAARYAAGVSVGQKVTLYRTPVQGGGPAAYSFGEFSRTIPLLVVVAVFAAAVIAVARLRGLMALVGLAFAAFVMVEFMFPALISGANPVLVGLVGGSAIMFVVIYAAHGFSARSTTALVGTLFGLGLSALFGWVVTRWAHLTGVTTEDDYSLAASTPDMKLTSMVICGIIVAGLGVLNDVTITQASAVWELADGESNPRHLFRRAMRIGRDHIASTVYTIAFATAGTSIATILLIALYDQPLLTILTGELEATEILRTLVGSIALVLAVPVTTAIGVALVRAGRSAQRVERSPSGSG